MGHDLSQLQLEIGKDVLKYSYIKQRTVRYINRDALSPGLLSFGASCSQV